MSASQMKQDAVSQDEDGSWGFTCPINDGTCGVRDSDQSHTSLGWPSKKLALKRLDQHIAEHIEGDAARAEGREPDRSAIQSTAEFLAEHGLIPSGDGKTVVSSKDFA